MLLMCRIGFNLILIYQAKQWETAHLRYSQATVRDEQLPHTVYLVFNIHLRSQA